MNGNHFVARAFFLVTVLLGLGGAGCAGAGGAWSTAGFEQKAYGWKAKYAPGTRGKLLGEPWRLDNWEPGMDGTTLEQKRGDQYDAKVWVDENDDGKMDFGETSTKPLFDLKLTNTRDNGFIWVATRELSPGMASKDLDVLLNDFGASLLAGGNGSLAGGKLLGFVTTKKETRLGSRAAISEVVELASPDMVKADPQARTGKMLLVLSRFTYAEPIPTSTPTTETTENLDGSTTQTASPYTPKPRKRTGVLLLGYFNDMAHFHDHLKAFDDFLGRIAWMPPSDAPPKVPASPAPANPAPAEESSAQPGALPTKRTDASEI